MQNMEFFNENLRNTETAEGNLIEDYDANNHNVLIRCQRAGCNCTGSWQESARFYFPASSPNRPTTGRIVLQGGGGRRK